RVARYHRGTGGLFAGRGHPVCAAYLGHGHPDTDCLSLCFRLYPALAEPGCTGKGKESGAQVAVHPRMGRYAWRSIAGIGVSHSAVAPERRATYAAHPGPVHYVYDDIGYHRIKVTCDAYFPPPVESGGSWRYSAHGLIDGIHPAAAGEAGRRTHGF